MPCSRAGPGLPCSPAPAISHCFRPSLLPPESLVGHSDGKKHKENMSVCSSESQTSIISSLQTAVHNPTKVAELKIAVYIAEHSSTLSVDHLGELLPVLDKKIYCSAELQITQKKMFTTTEECTCSMFCKTAERRHGEQHFSFIVDESTNEANVSCLAFSVRYYSAMKKKIVDTFYRLVPLQDCTADTLYKTVKNCMEEDNLNIGKLIGIGCDGANSMVGRKHSLSRLLQNDNPNITVFRCVCHSLHLAASKAFEVLPTALTFIIRETHSWFSSSPKRTSTYRDIYQTLESCSPVRVPGMAATRWLVRLEAINVILDQWDAFKLHFDMVVSNERCHTAKILNDAYRDPQKKLFMLFARKMLKEVVKVNKLFQAENADVTKLTKDLLNM